MLKKVLSACIALCLVLIMVLTSCAPAASQIVQTVIDNIASESSTGESANTGNQNQLQDISDSYTENLQIINMGERLTQEQSVSRLKAEYLIANNGYKEDDEVVIILNIGNNSLLDEYLNNTSSKYKSVSQYASSKEGIDHIARIVSEQDALIEELSSTGLISNIEHRYTTVMNAVAVKTTYKNFKQLDARTDIANVILSDTYNRPQAIDASAIENAVDIYPTGIFNPQSIKYTGVGTAVAVLDSGFDCEHTVFENNIDSSTMLINYSKVDSIFKDTRAFSLCKGLELKDVYYNDKIPFIFDYADKDYNVNPYDSEHGTHVAGIIGGKDDVITGIAVDTQLVLMKVFPDLDDGGKTEDILAALEDAILLGVDAINMSLGSSCGFAREKDGDAINKVYDAINESGISLITAASNSYSSAFGGEQGNTARVTNPDSGTVGSPSTYPAALSVASISGTKSNYLIANDNHIVFFSESNNNAGKANDFFKELGITEGESRVYEYVTIPGVGQKVNYTGLGDLTGKIALVRRGDNTFEDKALQAKNAGAVACIIYNNIEGDILMSMGKTDHIPTISISKENGTILAEKSTGKISIAFNQKAGPFMSDFSSWGPTPDLHLKPEITAHGGNIKSAVPGNKYDEMSGTSMATPNLCGIVVLIRQHLKEKYPEMSMKDISVLTNQMLMSSATIILNNEGNPYSPRKQGAGLASLYNVVNTRAYLTVDGIDRSKLDLLDDPSRSGVYTMNFNVKNFSDKPISFNLSLVAMTESVSASDKNFIAEKSHILSGNTVFSLVGTGGSLNGNVLTVEPNSTVPLKAVYTMTDADKKMIDESFPYGMYVEGFVKLTAVEKDDIDLNIPFLAFYGDWTEAPLFDKTYYEVDKEARDGSIDEEDKLKADYYATTPYGSYFYNYIIPLGTYLYDVDKEFYDEIPASEEHIAISDSLGTLDGISAVYAGLLRNAKTMTYRITDKITGEVIKELVVDNAHKAHSYGGAPVPNYEYLRWKSSELDFTNNHQYEFSMLATLDYKDGGTQTNTRNSFTFDFTFDNEAPIIKNVEYIKQYDKLKKCDRYYLNVTLYDNHYTQSIAPIAFTSTSSYVFLSENPIPVYSEKGKDTTVKIEITDYLKDLKSDALITNAIAFVVDDYALNSNIFLCELPGTRGDFKFTTDGTVEGTDMIFLSLYEDEVVDLTEYLSTTDETVDDNKDYLRYLSWKSSNERVLTVADGQVRAIRSGRATVTVTEAMNVKQAVLIINVKKRPSQESTANALAEITSSSDGKYRAMSRSKIDNVADASLDKVRFSHFETVFAYSRAAQQSEIGQTGDRKYISAFPSNSISFYPGEKIKLFYDIEPWYIADSCKVSITSTNEAVATVDEDGVVTALKKGNTTIVLRIEGSNISADININVKSEFVIEDRTLVAYKGLGGNVVIPDDEGILYIGAFAFCLYNTDTSIELTEDDYDANKIPSTNTSITSIVIPEGVEEIQKYAFYNCSGLKSVTLPSSIRFIREYAFYNDEKLSSINLEDVEAIGAYAFYNCKALTEVDFSSAYSLGVRAFQKCTGLTTVDLTNIRNTGFEVFAECSGLKSATLVKETTLSKGMFKKSGLTSIDIYEIREVPSECFKECKALKKVVFHNDVIKIAESAFAEAVSLDSIEFKGSVKVISDYAFYACDSLESVALPNCAFEAGNYIFAKCIKLNNVVISENTYIDVFGSMFEGTSLESFTLDAKNTNYAVSDDGNYLMNKKKDTIILAAINNISDELIIPKEIKEIGNGAFCGADITVLRILNKDIKIGDYAFARCHNLTDIHFPEASGTISLGARCFDSAGKLINIVRLDRVKTIGKYAFANTLSLLAVKLGADVTADEGAFFRSNVKAVTVGLRSSFGFGAFQRCSNLVSFIIDSGEDETVDPADGVHFGESCFVGATALSSIDLHKTDDTIEDQAFYGCSSLKAANLQNVKHVGKYAFADCSSLNAIIIPRVETIQEGAFARYDRNASAPAIITIELPNTLREMGDGVFAGCERLTKVSIPASIEKFGDYMFAFCLKLESVRLPDTLKRIGKQSFAGCEALRSINLENIEEIDELAFNSCVSLAFVNLSSLKSVEFGAFASSAILGTLASPSLTHVGDYAFQNTRISGVHAPNITHIGNGAFQSCTALTTFAFSENIEHVGVMAFQGSTSLKSFTFTKAEASHSDGQINDYAMLHNGALYTKLPNARWELSSIPCALDVKEFVVADNTYRIGLYAGNANTNITSIVLPASLKAIGNYAFNGCKNLTQVEFRSFTAPALESAYIRDTKLDADAPGFDILHNQFDLFGLELCYYTFKGLAGAEEPIKMVLPKNEDVEGYDSAIYLCFFGDAADADRSEYVAMDKTLTNFIGYYEDISNLKNILLTDETLINNAVAAYNAMKQNATDFGYTQSEWDNMVDVVFDAKAKLTTLKLNNASQAVRDLQIRIDALPDVYSSAVKGEMSYIEGILNNLSASDRGVLTLDKYNALLDGYINDTPSEDIPITPTEALPTDTEPIVTSASDISYQTPAIVLVVSVSLLVIAALVIALCSKIIRKRKENE